VRGLYVLRPLCPPVPPRPPAGRRGVARELALLRPARPLAKRFRKGVSGGGFIFVARPLVKLLRKKKLQTLAKVRTNSKGAFAIFAQS
jgi:hypothetical protein